MIETSENFDISLIKGKVLNQICIGLYQVVLRFDDDISISCESKIYIFDDKTTKKVVFPPNTSCVGILRLLGEKVVSVELNQNENLIITFPSKIVVEIEREIDGYESFQIWIGENFLVVQGWNE